MLQTTASQCERWGWGNMKNSLRKMRQTKVLWMIGCGFYNRLGRRGSVCLFSVLDSVGKGGAQVGVENMNIMFGLDRTTGLTRRGLHPN